jgi:hypothetical protein
MAAGPETHNLAAVVVLCRFVGGTGAAEATEDVEWADGLQRPRV